MLKIRREQTEAFREVEIKGFEDRMLDHLWTLFPANCEVLGDASLRRLVREGITRAARYGIDTEYGVCVFVDAMFAYGRDFDTDPSLPWALEILTSRSIRGQHLRADRLFDAALEHLDAARGIRAEEVR